MEFLEVNEGEFLNLEKVEIFRIVECDSEVFIEFLTGEKTSIKSWTFTDKSSAMGFLFREGVIKWI